MKLILGKNSTIIIIIPPTGGAFENPRSRNLLQPNKSTPTPVQTGWGYSYLAEAKSVIAGFRTPPLWVGVFLRSKCFSPGLKDERKGSGDF